MPAPAVRCLFQLSLDSGTLPDDWTNANVSPIFKKGDRHRAENYRPVSMTSVTSKLLEHIVCRAIMHHLEENGILTSKNHGFRSGFSCEPQLVATMDELSSSYDQGKQVDIAILDFPKHSTLSPTKSCFTNSTTTASEAHFTAGQNPSCVTGI